VPSGLVGTVQYLVGGQVLSASRTTPESVDLYAMLAAMVAAGDRACVMEVSSHALAQKRIAGVALAAAVFTNLTQDHLDYHEDMEEYFAAKSLLFHEHEVGARIVNRDDPWGRRLLATLEDALSFGMEEGDVRPEGPVEWGAWGSRFTLATPWGSLPVKSPLAGAFNVENVMAAVAACGALGVAPAVMAAGIARMGRVPGRFERVDAGQGFTALVDYAHTPDALEKLLANARRLTAGRLLVVFGCGGDRDRGKRPLMGRAAGELADLAFVTSDNPRGEEPEAIIDEIVAGMEGARAKVARVTDRREAIRLAVAGARPGDVLAVAGKGHENYQEANGRREPFSDAEELARAIREAGKAR
jgi:UDP-N-acetylmuramoyl-L-alanyl-D-glutamate--2,6-diaminopimelate ligase